MLRQHQLLRNGKIYSILERFDPIDTSALPLEVAREWENIPGESKICHDSWSSSSSKSTWSYVRFELFVDNEVWGSTEEREGTSSSGSSGSQVASTSPSASASSSHSSVESSAASRACTVSGSFVSSSVSACCASAEHISQILNVG